jgi:hypothetical protein
VSSEAIDCTTAGTRFPATSASRKCRPEAVGEARVIEAEQLEQGRGQIMHVNRIADNGIADKLRRT